MENRSRHVLHNSSTDNRTNLDVVGWIRLDQTSPWNLPFDSFASKIPATSIQNAKWWKALTLSKTSSIFGLASGVSSQHPTVRSQSLPSKSSKSSEAGLLGRRPRNIAATTCKSILRFPSVNGANRHEPRGDRNHYVDILVLAHIESAGKLCLLLDSCRDIAR